MKMPEYSLIKGVSYQEKGSNNDPIEFQGGTLVFPFWSDHNLPSHIREAFEVTGLTKDYVMCLIGRTWIPIARKNIRKN